jgi:DNA-binding CsgD family transcriptional regulator
MQTNTSDALSGASSQYLKKLGYLFRSPLLWSTAIIIAHLITDYKYSSVASVALLEFPARGVLYFCFFLFFCVCSFLPKRFTTFIQSKFSLIITFVFCIISSILRYALQINQTDALAYIYLLLETISFGTVFLLNGVFLSKLKEADLPLFVSLAFFIAIFITVVYISVPGVFSVLLSLLLLCVVFYPMIHVQNEEPDSLEEPLTKAAFKATSYCYISLFVLATILFFYDITTVGIQGPPRNTLSQTIVTGVISQSIISITLIALSLFGKVRSFHQVFRSLFVFCFFSIALTATPMPMHLDFVLREMGFAGFFILQLFIPLTIASHYAYDSRKVFSSAGGFFSISIVMAHISAFVLYPPFKGEYLLGETVTAALSLCLLFGVYVMFFNRSHTEDVIYPRKTIAQQEYSLEERCLAVASKFKLSKRERELLIYFANDKTNREIASVLFLAEGTINVHQYHVYKKLDVHNRNELINLVKNFKD